MGSITFKPTGSLSIIENYIGGPEQANNNDDWRNLSDTVVSYTLNPQVSLMANYDYGHDTVSGTSVHWQGVAGYLKYKANKYVAVVPRIEFYNDASGFTTGVVQNLTDATSIGRRSLRSTSQPAFWRSRRRSCMPAPQ